MRTIFLTLGLISCTHKDTNYDCRDGILWVKPYDRDDWLQTTKGCVAPPEIPLKAHAPDSPGISTGPNFGGGGSGLSVGGIGL